LSRIWNLLLFLKWIRVDCISPNKFKFSARMKGELCNNPLFKRLKLLVKSWLVFLLFL
jgi:hypothetical protein